MINDSINRFLGILCYPFASMEMFKEDRLQKYVDALNEESKKQSKSIKEQLKKDLVNYIRHNYTIYSYDEIYLYLEKCYLFDIRNDEEKIYNVLDSYCYIMENMATTLLSHRDGKIVFKYWKNEKDKEIFGGFAEHNKVALFHSLNCHLPMDVIAITYMLKNSHARYDINCLNYFYGNIEVADQQLSRILEKGVAENHLHKGVSRTFPSIWDSLMEPITAKNKKSFCVTEFVSGTKEQDRWVLFCILACGIVRAMLVLEIGKIHSFESCFQDKNDNKIYRLVENFCNGKKMEIYYEENFSDKDKDVIVGYYKMLWEELEDFLSSDTFSRKFCTSFLAENVELHTFDENIFLYYALQILLDKNTNPFTRKCIMQYLRIRNYLFRTSVQQKTIKGLDYFQEEHYRVNSAIAHLNVDNFWETAIREQLQTQNIHKIEFRSSFRDKSSQLKKDIIKFLKAYKKILEEDYCYKKEEKYILQKKIPQVGLVLHFLKKWDEQVPEKCFENGKEDCLYFQFGKLQKNYQTQIENFIQLRKEEPELSRYLVGIDAASLESATPIWVFAPIYEKARDGWSDQIGRYKNNKYVQSLGFTFHAGEDFRHILSGLRRIDEAVEYLKFHAGDRIGHGIALGLSAKEWKIQNPVVIIPQIEALENYLWAYDMLSENYSNFQATILAYMEKRILDLAKKVYGSINGVTIGMLILGYQKMFDSNFREDVFQKMDENQNLRIEFCEKIQKGESIFWTENLLVAARHCKSFVKEMERPIHYEVTEQDLLIIEELQKILIEKLGKKGIVIEVNPSSNTAIADLDTFKENQFYHMNYTNDVENLIVCVNSDDPAVFNTNVSNELAYIYYGMLEQNISRDAALRWIDQIRENGINSSFIHREESDETIFRNLENLLKQI